MAILGIVWWVWLLLLAFLALLAWLWNRSGGGTGPAGPLPSPPPYPSVAASMSTVAGAVLIPQAQWNGPARHARRTTETYTFLRQVYDPIDPGNPLSPAQGIALRFRLVHSPEENAEIVAVTNGGQVSGSPWWGAVTGVDGQLDVEVRVAGRELASSEQSSMQVIAEELSPAGQVLRGVIHDVIVVPSGQ